VVGPCRACHEEDAPAASACLVVEWVVEKVTLAGPANFPLSAIDEDQLQ
jgi:hypothetical protein